MKYLILVCVCELFIVNYCEVVILVISGYTVILNYCKLP